jgi:hypothetical protein
MQPILEDIRSISLKKAFLNVRGRLRAGWKIVFYAALAILGMLIAVSTYQAIAQIFTLNQTAASRSAMTIGMYASLLIGVILPAVFMLRIVDGSSGKALGFSFHDRVWIEVGQGILQSTCMATLIFLIELTTGWIDVRWRIRGDSSAGIRLSGTGSRYREGGGCVHLLLCFWPISRCESQRKPTCSCQYDACRSLALKRLS